MRRLEHPCQRKQRCTKRGRRRAIDFLEMGPWTWPDAARHYEMRRYVRQELDLKGPPQLRAGEVLLVAVKHDQGELWVLPHNEAPEHRREGTFLGGAEQVWRDAECALPRNLPLLWRSVRAETNHIPRARWIHRSPDRAGLNPSLEGRSFGLAFALAIASRLINIPVPADLVASADLDERGSLGRVEGLEAKLEVVASLALHVRRFIVAHEQHEEALEIVQRRGWDHLEIRSYKRLGEALADIFEGLPEHLERLGEFEEDRVALVNSFFRLALGERDASIDWSPVAQAAHHALESWRPSLSETNQRKLEFAKAVAYRHCENEGGLPVPMREWMRGFPNPTQIEIMAHVTQQAADTGSPDPVKVLEMANEDIPSLGESFPPHLKLLGARGRLYYSAFGDIERSLKDQFAAIDGWRRLWQFGPISYPLSYAYMLIGVLAAEGESVGDRYERANELEAELNRGGTACRSNPYVRLGRGRALVEMRRFQEAREVLEELYESERNPDHVNRSTERWLRRARQDSRPHEVRGRRHESDILIELDDVLRREDAQQARLHMRELLKKSTSLCNLLLASVTMEIVSPEAPAFLARRFPY